MMTDPLVPPLVPPGEPPKSTARERPRLTGQRCRCGACGELFNSTYSFDTHRVGRFEVDRRCQSAAEMIDAGMSRNAGGFWITETRDQRQKRTGSSGLSPISGDHGRPATTLHAP
jgi:hypothetical protein